LVVIAFTVSAAAWASDATPRLLRLAIVVLMTDPIKVVFVESDPKLASASTDLPTTLATAVDLSEVLKDAELASEDIVPEIIFSVAEAATLASLDTAPSPDIAPAASAAAPEVTSEFPKPDCSLTVATAATLADAMDLTIAPSCEPSILAADSASTALLEISLIVPTKVD
jgi:hypothetical protein